MPFRPDQGVGRFSHQVRPHRPDQGGAGREPARGAVHRADGGRARPAGHRGLRVHRLAAAGHPERARAQGGGGPAVQGAEPGHAARADRRPTSRRCNGCRSSSRRWPRASTRPRAGSTCCGRRSAGSARDLERRECDLPRRSRRRARSSPTCAPGTPTSTRTCRPRRGASGSSKRLSRPIRPSIPRALRSTRSCSGREIEIEDLRARSARIDREISRVQGRVDLAPRTEQHLATLTRDLGQMRESYLALLKKRMDAQMAEKMERRWQGERFKVLDPADVPEKAAYPDRLLFALVGLVGGTGLGLRLRVRAGMARSLDQERRGPRGARSRAAPGGDSLDRAVASVGSGRPVDRRGLAFGGSSCWRSTSPGWWGRSWSRSTSGSGTTANALLEYDAACSRRHR